MGVTVTRTAMLQHCRALTAACNYTEGEVLVCVLDFKREVGLWHAIMCVSISLFSVISGARVLCIIDSLFSYE